MHLRPGSSYYILHQKENIEEPLHIIFPGIKMLMIAQLLGILFIFSLMADVVESFKDGTITSMKMKVYIPYLGTYLRIGSFKAECINT
ncbi:CLUMA_CG008782, isoform A [Clunio marinus]|uniref:CLUMA_CG008782, isoform A n=1 Tax=Clunio marinus TaxID=568069 RepID=A0A1J1I6Q0_9DIPT|nr:CLUMA_CG008782, isoform A [Clunio marinus]